MPKRLKIDPAQDFDEEFETKLIDMVGDLLKHHTKADILYHLSKVTATEIPLHTFEAVRNNNPAIDRLRVEGGWIYVILRSGFMSSAFTPDEPPIINYERED